MILMNNYLTDIEFRTRATDLLQGYLEELQLEVDNFIDYDEASRVRWIVVELGIVLDKDVSETLRDIDEWINDGDELDG